MEIVKVFEGSNITFEQKNGKLMVNATQMAKSFNRRTNDWLSNQQTKDLIATYSAETGIPATELIVVIQGGNNQGTWLNEDLALVFAQWLSPKFYLWCNAQIKELLTKGSVSLKPKTRRELAEENLALIIELEEKDKLLLEQAPKVDFYEAVTGSTDTVDMATVAKVLDMGIGRNNLFELLRNKGILTSRNAPMQRYVDLGWFRQIESTYNKPDGSTCINIKTVVFQKGIEGIRKIILNNK